MSVRTLSFAAVFLAAAIVSALAQGQQRPGHQPPPGRVITGPQKPLGDPSPAEAGQGADSQLVQRIEQLEEHIVDLQVMVGTLETLARAGAGVPAPVSQGPGLPGSGSAGQDGARIEALETQVRALTAQLEQLSEYVRSLDGTAARAPGPMTPSQPIGPGSGRADLGGVSGSGSGPGTGIGSFGTTVTTGGADPIGEMLSADPREEMQTAALDPPSGASPKQLYERAYGLLLQQNYAAAEAGFDDFLKRYPNDELAANAQYWLGETHYVRGQYKAAASAFLKVSRSHAKSAKAPDSMLKLAMSLDRLGQRDAACQAYSELVARYPNSPAHVRERAQSERQRAGCR